MAFGITTYKSKLMDEIDKAAADSLAPLYTLDLMIGRGPETGNPAAGIWVYQTKAGGDEDLLSFDDARMRAYYDRMRESGAVAEEQQGDPIRISTNGNYLANSESALRHLLTKYNYNCEVRVKVPLLRIQWVIPKDKVVQILNDGTFAAKIKEMHEALHEGFKWDPWLGGARKGKVGAAEHKKAFGSQLGKQYRFNRKDKP